MNLFVSTMLPDVFIIEPKVYQDSRGYFMETWNQNVYEQVHVVAKWVQDNESMSCAGVLRGLHYQIPPFSQAKLVRVILGRVLDVAVDVREGSETFGKYVAVELSGENKRQLYIPRGFAHGFVVLEDRTSFSYKCDNYYQPSYEKGIRFDDPALGIDWGIKDSDLIISNKDLKLPLLSQAEFS